jgi:hypothetical protein
MANYTKRQLIDLIEKLPEDSNIAFVAAHDMIEGDILIPIGEFDEDHPNADCFFISAGDPDELADIESTKVTKVKPLVLGLTDMMSQRGY